MAREYFPDALEEKFLGLVVRHLWSGNGVEPVSWSSMKISYLDVKTNTQKRYLLNIKRRSAFFLNASWHGCQNIKPIAESATRRRQGAKFNYMWALPPASLPTETQNDKTLFAAILDLRVACYETRTDTPRNPPFYRYQLCPQEIEFPGRKQ
jgi:hypothetical protein